MEGKPLVQLQGVKKFTGMLMAVLQHLRGSVLNFMLANLSESWVNLALVKPRW
jgi:hypothetical protein